MGRGGVGTDTGTCNMGELQMSLLHACSIVSIKPGVTATLDQSIIFVLAVTPGEALNKALQYCGMHLSGQTCQVVVSQVPKPALTIRDTMPQMGEYVKMN